MPLGWVKKIMVLSRVKSWVRACEDHWFDATRHVRTIGDERKPDSSEIVGELRDCHVYAPVRVANARAALRDLPVSNLSRYTFVDVGSGKGRMLFVAAELGFRKVMGVEFATGLHRQAVENIGRYRHLGRRCSDLESVLADAGRFEFPNDDLVLYLFNPFGPEVMTRMLGNLERSIRMHPRHVVVVMLWPENADLVARMEGMSLYRQTSRYHIYQLGGAQR
jgi:SAM-dependent methyltransferase